MTFIGLRGVICQKTELFIVDSSGDCGSMKIMVGSIFGRCVENLLIAVGIFHGLSFPLLWILYRVLCPLYHSHWNLKKVYKTDKTNYVVTISCLP
jgi:hypothetical protein